MQKKIFRHSLGLTAVAVLATVLLISLVLFDRLKKDFWAQLAQSADYLTVIYQEGGLAGLSSLELADRLTLIAPDGTVLYDNQADSQKMNDHNDRPEVEQARETGSGSSQRVSKTLLAGNFYYAKLLPDQTVLRVAGTQASLAALYLQLILPGLVIFGGVLLLTLFWSRRTAKKLVAPINLLDLAQPQSDLQYPELAPLAHRLTTQNRQIAEQMGHLQQKDRELNLITSHMKEGLLVLDQEDRLLLANPVAQDIFAITAADFQQPFVAVQRQEQFLQALIAIKAAGSQQFPFEAAGRSYQVLLDPVFQEQQFLGSVLFLFDRTATATQEKMRREFTANVTHELKTPLTSIAGYAEIMHAGLVQPSDMPRFAGKIYDESQRLLALVNDTLKLSQLEHQAEMTVSLIDWPTLTAQIGQALQPALEQKGQVLHKKIAGTARFYGYPSVLQEILYNLLENASKYSKDRSEITVEVIEAAGGIRLTVADQGQGIPVPERERVFERFYRGDKSHSQQIPGTGLGLAIVKHGVLLHHGQIKIMDNPEGGSVFVIYLPQVLPQ